MLVSPLYELHEVGAQVHSMFDDADGLEHESVVVGGRRQVGSGGDLQKLRDTQQLGFVDVHRQVFKDVVRAEAGGVLLPLSVAQE